MVPPAAPWGGRLARRIGSFRFFFLLLVSSFLAFVAGLALVGWSFYSTPLLERSTHPLYPFLKPSGIVGYPLGIVGTVMMLLIFLYPLHKRSEFLQTVGTQAQWLQVHIFLGFAGPILVTFHTAGKLGGIISIAFCSMWAMALSGIVGRYLYAKIPRTVQGNQMTLREIEDQLALLVSLLRHNERQEVVLEGIEVFLARTHRHGGGLIKAVGRVAWDDLQLPLNTLKIWLMVRRDHTLSFRQRLRVSHLILRQQRLLNQLAVLDASQRLFCCWHAFHKPFTVLTFFILSLHIAATIYRVTA